MMDEALAFKQLDVSHYDMLPRLLAQAGYSDRDNDKITLSRNPDGSINNNRVTTQERRHATESLSLSWSMLDLGVGYDNTVQQAERVQIAGEKRRKAMHLLMQDVRSAYWRAYSAQKLCGEVQGTTRLAEEALTTGPTQMKLAEAGVALADQRRVATQMAVLAQLHLARQQYANALQQFQRADAIWQTDSRISEHMKNREQAQAQSKLDVVANQTTSILSLLRRYQAMSQLYTAEARLQATLGVEPKIGSVFETSLKDRVRDLDSAHSVWSSLKVQPQAPSSGGGQ